MNKLSDEAVALASALSTQTTGIDSVEVVVCPVFTALSAVSGALKESNIALGGQNCYTKDSGAFTGEISPKMLQDVGCSWVIIGHSERRQIFGETDGLLNEKLKFALAEGLKVMFCIGETLEERESGNMNDVLRRQVTKGLDGLSESDFASVAIAYEPVWAIGTGVVASPAQAEEAHAFVRGLVKDQFGETVAGGLRIQYGGSVKPDNAAELMANENVDGALVGGAALDAESFAGIIKAVG
jgi:triosephosphate isomerase